MKATSENLKNKKTVEADILTMVAADEYPITSMIPTISAPGSMEFTVYSDDDGVPQMDATAETQPVTDIENQMENINPINIKGQWFRRSWGVSKLALKGHTFAGVKDPVAHSKMMAIKKLKREVECAILSDYPAEIQDGTKGYRTAGLGHWISPDCEDVKNPQERTPAAQICDTDDFNEDKLTDILDSMWESVGADSDIIAVCGVSARGKFRDMARTDYATTSAQHRVRVAQGADMTITNSVMFYRGDYNKVELHTSKWIAREGKKGITDKSRNRIYMFQLKHLAKCYYQGIENMEFVNDPTGRSGVVDTILALVCKSPKAMAKVHHDA